MSGEVSFQSWLIKQPVVVSVPVYSGGLCTGVAVQQRRREMQKQTGPAPAWGSRPSCSQQMSREAEIPKLRGTSSPEQGETSFLN